MNWVPVPMDGQVTIAAESTSLQVRTTLTDDLLDEPDEPNETIQLLATHISGTLAPTGNDFDAEATILDDDATPSTENNTVTTPEDVSYVFDSADIPFNDADGDMLALIRIESISLPNGGSLVLNNGMTTLNVVPGMEITKVQLDSGFLQFVPDADEFGLMYASFQFTVSDGANYSTAATMTIDVTPVPDPPQAVDDMASTDERTAVHITPLMNDWDPDIDALVLVEINGTPIATGESVTLPSGAVLTLNADGSLSYDPNGQFDTLAEGESALDSFDYTISDGVHTDSAQVTVTIDGVNEPPVAGDDFARTPVDTPVTVPVLGNDHDPNGDPLAVVVLNVDQGGTTHVNPDGTVTFTPYPGFTGTSTITYLVEDPHGGTDVATIEIEVFLPYSWDSFHDFSKDFASIDSDLAAMNNRILSQEIFSLAAEPIFSGYARPGTEVSGRIYDEAGRLIGEGRATSDPGGNWMMQFQGVAKFQHFRIEFDYVRQSTDIYGYFGVNPSDNSYQAMQPLTGWDEALSANSAMRGGPHNSLMAMHQQHNNPIGFGEEM
jgi:VCBS repeat-containing protein